MRNRIFDAMRLLFRVSLCASLILGALLTLGQLAGVIAMQPDWITGSERLFFKPAMVAAAMFGVLAFLGSYFRPDEAP